MSFKTSLFPRLAAMLLLAQVVLAEPVNINTADATALAKALDGIGPAKAKAIVSYREKNGPFKSVDQLAMVEGITQKLIEKNRADIRLGGGKTGAPGAAVAGGKTGQARLVSGVLRPRGREFCTNFASSRRGPAGRVLRACYGFGPEKPEPVCPSR